MATIAKLSGIVDADADAADTDLTAPVRTNQTPDQWERQLQAYNAQVKYLQSVQIPGPPG